MPAVKRQSPRQARDPHGLSMTAPGPTWANGGGQGGAGGPASRGAYLKAGEDKKTSPYLGTPGWFSREILKLKPYDWQDRVMWDIAVGERPVALCAANGSGKTQCVAAPIILWHCAVFPKSQVVTTAGVFRQVKEQLWNTLRGAQVNLGSAWEINTVDLLAPNGSRAVGFSTDDPGKFEGWHNDNLLMIVDEAKSVPDQIFQAIERCQPTRLLLMSSAGSAEGEFAAAFSVRKKFYSTHIVTSYDCPHITQAWIDRQIEKWGRDHPLIRSMIFSEFTEAHGTNTVLTRTAVANALSRPPAFVPGGRVAFIDWAAGGDENVIAIVNGNRLEKLLHWRDKDTMAAAGTAVMLLREHNVPANGVFADDGGLGHPINDAITRAGIPVRRILNGARAWDPEHFANLGAELWFTAARAIEEGKFILQDDEVLLQQLTTRRRVVLPTGKLGLESKDDLRARGHGSPDRADAVLAAIAIAHLSGGGYGVSDEVSDSDRQDDAAEQAAEQFIGVFAGV